ncbi:hypothetical protein NA57DRAFT_71103 [Rhizodiscina lignyota]|uniref:Inositolphosphotransferase Aur1/Ipt1 domain-containing protein n=1 Tax=Rhizodiscina lignyota TaxID=1504668 RepID=A0A9P4IRQ2_9PEZI|nr:hypothetical protein NA57DRAFT_71103 [Rhizodiscina lignyota]
MGVGGLVEPAVVIGLLFGGTWINRNTSYSMYNSSRSSRWRKDPLDRMEDDIGSPPPPVHGLGENSGSGPSSPSLLPAQEPTWRKREVNLWGWRRELTSPNTRVFKGCLLSRLLRKFPFLVEAWYWALIYWVYQLGRAFTAVTLVESTVDVARQHALQLIHIEQKLHIFWEVPIQKAFMAHPLLMTWTNRIYSFIHIPGTIAFLVWLYYHTTTRNRLLERQSGKPRGEVDGSPAGPALYEARRRTMAVCNLIAFVVFTLWPCMPPRLLSDKDVPGDIGEESRSYGFVDTVHGEGGESSVWTQNKFCNQYAAMPSLHFGYSLLIGLTILTIPLPQRQNRRLTISLPFRLSIRLPSPKRLALLSIGIAYPLTILLAIIATANHFTLDAVAGACVCGVAWMGNKVLLNLLFVEDYFLWCVRIHKPEKYSVDWEQKEDDEEDDIREEKWGKGVIDA